MKQKELNKSFMMISNWKIGLYGLYMYASYKKYFSTLINPFRPEFTIVIFIHYKPRIAVAILNL